MKKRQTENEELILDACREIGNIGAGSAITSLSHMTHMRFQETITHAIRLGDQVFEDAIGDLRALEENTYGILFPIQGELQGAMLYLINDEMMDKLTAVAVTDLGEELTREGRLVMLKELANVMTSAYLTGISPYVTKKMQINIPGIAHDMAGAMMTDVVSVLGHMGPESLCIYSSFSVDDNADGCRLFFFLYQKTEEEIYDVLGLEQL